MALLQRRGETRLATVVIVTVGAVLAIHMHVVINEINELNEINEIILFQTVATRYCSLMLACLRLSVGLGFFLFRAKYLKEK